MQMQNKLAKILQILVHIQTLSFELIILSGALMHYYTEQVYFDMSIAPMSNPFLAISPKE
ncbi:hypothetical protein RSAG8_09721, partial [Rhizoctonia solani AG-8 WAC10335]